MRGEIPYDQELLIKSIVRHFKSLTRGPYGTETARGAVRSNSVEGLILGESELAWRAYFAAKKFTESTHGKSGQVKLARLLEALNAQPTESQICFAEQLAHEMNNISVEDHGNTIIQHGAKRRCTSSVQRSVCESNVTAMETSMSTSLTPTAPTRSSTESTSTEDSSTTVYVNADLSESEQTLHDAATQKDVYTGASLVKSATLFPPEFMQAIERVPSTPAGNLSANISLFLQQGEIRTKFGCQMEIVVAKEKVPLYAKKLFNTDVEIRNGVRYLTLPGGAKIEPDPHLKLRSCSRDAIKDVIGEEVHQAFSVSPLYEREKREVRAFTDGASMTISSNAEEGGRIALLLGEWHAIRYRHDLYSS